MPAALLFSYAALSVFFSSFDIILMWKRELVALLAFLMSFDCFVLCVSSLHYSGLICSVGLWYILIKLTSS